MTARKAELPVEAGDDSPLLLAVVAELAYPDGSMTVAGLRRLHASGKLAVERTNGRLYTTLRDIREMRKRCRDEGKAPGSTSERASGGSTATADRAPGSSETARSSEA